MKTETGWINRHFLFFHSWMVEVGFIKSDIIEKYGTEGFPDHDIYMKRKCRRSREWKTYGPVAHL